MLLMSHRWNVFCLRCPNQGKTMVGLRSLYQSDTTREQNIQHQNILQVFKLVSPNLALHITFSSAEHMHNAVTLLGLMTSSQTTSL
jgi:hypothetical protein